jgi:tetratricopeptide (TPR) repeat protein
VAALFALHPLHVESVAWVAERKDVLSTFFWLLTVWAYVRYAEQPTRRPYLLLSLGLYALGLMAKPMLVTLPFVLLLLDYWPLGRTCWADPCSGALRAPTSAVTDRRYKAASVGELIWEKLPFLGLALASSAVTVQMQSHVVRTLAKLPMGARVDNALVSYARYIGKTLWPGGLAVFYPYETWSPRSVMGAAAILLGITCVALWRARREPCLVVGWLWFLGMLVPVIGLVQVGLQSMADRYTYLSSVGLFLMLAWGLPSRCSRASMKRGIAAVAVAVVGVCAALCAVQVRYWQNTETVFGHAIEVTKDNWLAHYNLGLDLAKSHKLPEAVEHFEQSVRIKPYYADAQFNLGLALLLQGKTQDAIGPFEQVLRVTPNDADAHDNLGLALVRLGKAQEAMTQFELALWNRPDYPDAQNSLAWLLATLEPGHGGDPERAVTLAQRACQRTGYRAVAYLRTLAVAYAATGRFTEAVATAQKAAELARAGGQPQLVGQLEGLVESFRAGRAYVNP